MRRVEKPSWETVCRIMGTTIVGVLFVLYCVSTFSNSVVIERTVAFAFLGIATGLIGLPSGYRFVVQRNGDRSSR